MAEDILFKFDNFMFSYRVGGILIRDNKILLQKPPNDEYAIIGGHVQAFEDSAQTLEREFFEELHTCIKAENLIAIGEIFFLWGERPCHQISLYYNVSLAGTVSIPSEGVFHGYDDLGGERIDLDFCWVPLDNLNSLTVYPTELIPHITANNGGVLHFVSKQI